MNGPEHYREAERLLAETEGSIRDAVAAGSSVHLEVAREVAPVSLAAAQVHATLANAAATEQLAAAVGNLPTYEGMLAVYAFGGVNPR